MHHPVCDGGGHNNQPCYNQEVPIKKGSVTGGLVQLGNNIYNVAANRPVDSFANTTQAIALYVSSNLDKAGEYRTASVNLELPEIPVTVLPADTSYMITIALFGEEIKTYACALKARRDNQGKIFGIIMGQCTKAMLDQIEADSNWSAVSNQCELIRLLKLIRSNS